jgi:hypothetical protein
MTALTRHRDRGSDAGRPYLGRHEHAFASAMTENDSTTAAADLAEKILDEVSSAEQDWPRIAQWARELVEVAELATASPPDTD